MEECAIVTTLMTTWYQLSKVDESPMVDATLYGLMIWGLLYLTTSWLDIFQAIWRVVIFQLGHKEAHMLVVKRIFRYLKGTIDFGLWYPNSKNITLNSYTDGDWDWSVDHRKGTSGNDFFLGD